MDSKGVFGYSKVEKEHVNNENHESFKELTSSDDNDLPKRPEEQSWTTVKCRHACSLDSVPPVQQGPRRVKENIKELTVTILLLTFPHSFSSYTLCMLLPHAYYFLFTFLFPSTDFLFFHAQPYCL